MKTKMVGILGAVSLLAIAGTAAAVVITETSPFVIQKLDFTAEGVRVFQTGGVSVNPGCGHTDYYEPTPLTSADREAFDKGLTSAFLAGKSISLAIQGCGNNNRPAYVIVHLPIQ